MLLSFFSGRLMESPSAVRLNRTGPYPSSSTFLIFCGNSLLSAANDLMITFPFSGQAKTVAYKSFLVWVKLNFEGSDVDPIYGLNTPAYLCIDDVTIE